MPDLFGSYIIHEELGAGGMATVHLAEWNKNEGGYRRRVALKRLFPQVANIPELVAAFIDEARLARYLKHPNIAQVYEFGRVKGVYFIAFEFVPGPTVDQLVRHCRAHVGPIPVRIVLEIASQVCEALDHAHTMRGEENEPLGIVHRDVSPQNLIVSSSGFVKLIDFGLAKAKYQSTDSQAGIIKGKLNYVAPEYLSGQLDARCDLWAVGVVMHELLTGQRLFLADDGFETLKRIRTMQIPQPSRFNAEVGSDLDELVMTALERDPARRWQTAADLRAAINARAARGRELSKAQLVAWVEWAFSQKQKQKEDSGVSALHEILESGQIVEVDEASAPKMLPASSAAMMERRRESRQAIPRPVVAPEAAPPEPRAQADQHGTLVEHARPRRRSRSWSGLLVWLGIAIVALGGWTVYANVLSDDSAVRADAERVAREAAGCGASCKLSHIEGARGVLSETIVFTLDGKDVTATCRRALVAFGSYACVVAVGAK